jgi:hypothetical protein
MVAEHPMVFDAAGFYGHNECKSLFELNKIRNIKDFAKQKDAS